MAAIAHYWRNTSTETLYRESHGKLDFIDTKGAWHKSALTVGQFHNCCRRGEFYRVDKSQPELYEHDTAN